MTTDGAIFDRDFVLCQQLQVEARLKLSEPIALEEAKRPKLLAVSNKYGLLAVGTTKGFIVDYSKTFSEALMSSQKGSVSDYASPTMRSVDLPLVIQLAFSGDSSSILALTEKKLFVYEAASVMSGVTKPKTEIAFNEPALDMAANPGEYPDKCLIIFKSGKLSYVHDLKTLSATGLTDIEVGCWSARGKMAAVGNSKGEILQLDISGQVKAAIPPPQSFIDDYGSIGFKDLNWVDNKVLIGVYCSKPEDIQDTPATAVFSVTRNAQSQYDYVKMDDPSFNISNLISYNSFVINCYGSSLKRLVMSASTGSSDVGGVAFSNQSDSGDEVWGNWTFPDTKGIILPLNANDQDTFPIGLAGDFTDTVPPPATSADEPEYPPCPRIWVFSTEGELTGFFLINKDAFSKNEKFEMSRIEQIPKAATSFGVGQTFAGANFGFGQKVDGPPKPASFGVSAVPKTVSQTSNLASGFGFGSPLPPKKDETAAPTVSFGFPAAAAPTNVMKTPEAKSEKPQSSSFDIKGTLQEAVTKASKPTKSIDQMNEAEVFVSKFDEMYTSLNGDIESLRKEMQSLSALVPDLTSTNDLVKNIQRVESAAKLASKYLKVVRGNLDVMAEKRTALVDGFSLNQFRMTDLKNHMEAYKKNVETPPSGLDSESAALKKKLTDKRALVLKQVRELSSKIGARKSDQNSSGPVPWEAVKNTLQKLTDKSYKLETKVDHLEDKFRAVTLSSNSSTAKGRNTYCLDDSDLEIDEDEIKAFVASIAKKAVSPKKEAEKSILLRNLKKMKPTSTKIDQVARPPSVMLDLLMNLPKWEAEVKEVEAPESPEIQAKEPAKKITALPFAPPSVDKKPEPPVTLFGKPAEKTVGEKSFTSFGLAKPAEKTETEEKPGFAVPSIGFPKASSEANKKTESTAPLFGFPKPTEKAESVSKPAPSSLPFPGFSKPTEQTDKKPDSTVASVFGFAKPSDSEEKKPAASVPFPGFAKPAEIEKKEPAKVSFTMTPKPETMNTNGASTSLFGAPIKPKETKSENAAASMLAKKEPAKSLFAIPAKPGAKTDIVKAPTEASEKASSDEKDADAPPKFGFGALNGSSSSQPLVSFGFGSAASTESKPALGFGFAKVDQPKEAETKPKSPAKSQSLFENSFRTPSPAKQDSDDDSESEKTAPSSPAKSVASVTSQISTASKSPAKIGISAAPTLFKKSEAAKSPEPKAFSSPAAVPVDTTPESPQLNEVSVIEEEIGEDINDSIVNEQSTSSLAIDEDNDVMDDGDMQDDIADVSVSPKNQGLADPFALSSLGGFGGLGSSKPVSSNAVNPMFGNVQAGAATTKPASFGAFGATAAPANPFGGFGSTTLTAAPAFGSSAFGATTTVPTPAFGATTTAATPAFGATTTLAFGATTTAATTAFGATTTPAFGATTTPKPAFGSAAFGQPAFGSSTPSSTTPAFGQTAFGSSPAPGFGQSSLATPPQPAFGQTAFGSASTSTTGFGQTGFGAAASAPKFGASTGFGSQAASSPGFGGFGQAPAGSTSFGSVASGAPTAFGAVASNAPTSFGSVGSNPGASPFGSAAKSNTTSVFGSSAPQTGNPGFGSFGGASNSNSKPGGSAFSSYRG